MEGTVSSNELPAAVPQVQLANVLAIPAVRQLGLLIGVAASIAVGFWLVLWSQEPDYAQLFAGLEERDAAAVTGALQTSGIEFKLNDVNGAIMVRADKVREARLQLASQGLPGSVSAGMESVSEQSSFGVSQFMETARYRHAQEAELSRTIKSLRAVQDARVHLAIPKQSAFIRDQQSPTASVLLHLYGGQQLEAGQAAAIVNLVASSIPGMLASDVTLVDQFGRLLSVDDDLSNDAMTANQFKIKRGMEQDYRQRIEQLLMPLLGVGAVRAEVVADLDFTISEQTRESFDPERTVVRSEAVTEQQRSAGEGDPLGVPGALSNTPPEAGGIVNAETTDAATTLNSNRSSTRNYEVDKTISHTRNPSGTIRRLSVAVLVDETSLSAGDADEADAQTQREQSLARITTLVREAVGFEAARGDTVEVVSAPFRAVAELGEIESPPFWQQPALREMMKQGIGVVLALALAFGVVRPMLRSIVAPTGNSGLTNLLPSANSTVATVGGQLEGPASGGGLSYQDKVSAARNITGHDPARVAQVVRKWIDNDD